MTRREEDELIRRAERMRDDCYGRPYERRYMENYNYTTPEKTSGLAVASMVLGICSFIVLICGILAIIFGCCVLGSEKKGRGMAWAGLITGTCGLVLGLLVVLF